MNKGLLARTPRGRVATPEAYEHLGLQVPAHLLANDVETDE
jgi:Holliday junction resolvasome RuvABC ATP-dependent DNA helicase subunit